MTVKANFSPATPPTGPTGQDPLSTLAGAIQGSKVQIHVQASGGANPLNGIQIVRVCRPGLTGITTVAQLNPSNGACIGNPFSTTSGVNNDQTSNGGTVASDPGTHTFADTSIIVGTGTATWNTGTGPTSLTCDATHACSVWVAVSVGAGVDSSGFVFKHYELTYAGAPASPNLSVTPGNGNLTVHVDDATAGGVAAGDGNSAAPIAQYDITVTGPGGGTFSLTAPGSHQFGGLTNFSSYTVSATRTNSTQSNQTPATTPFTSAPATLNNQQPSPTPPSTPSGTSGDTRVDLSWTISGSTPTSYSVNAKEVPTGSADCTPAGTPVPGSPVNTGSAATTYSYTGLTNGHLYCFQVAGVYNGGANTGAFSPFGGPFTPNGRIITQTITVTRPAGNLVLTQVCGAHGVTTTGTAPTYTGPNASVDGTPVGQPDGLFPQYPYPVDSNGVGEANYKTNCNIALGTAHFLTTGTGAGQFYEANGVLNQVTVVDTRDGDPGFQVNGQMGTFDDGAGHTFSGSELGWTPIKTSDSPAFTDSLGNPYDQTVTAGPVVNPNSTVAGGLASGKQLAAAPAGAGLGIAVLDANLKLWIPVFDHSGTYTGILTITAL